MNRTALLLALLAGHATAAEYLTEVESPVYEAPGAAATAILEKAKGCAAAIASNDQVRDMLVEAGTDSSTLTAISRIGYTDAMTARTLRSSMAIMAKEGRFKIKHTKIEFLNVGQYAIGPEWIPVGKWWGAGGKKAEQMLVQRNTDLAACIQKPADPVKDNW